MESGLCDELCIRLSTRKVVAGGRWRGAGRAGDTLGDGGFSFVK